MPVSSARQGVSVLCRGCIVLISASEGEDDETDLRWSRRQSRGPG